MLRGSSKNLLTLRFRQARTNGLVTVAYISFIPCGADAVHAARAEVSGIYPEGLQEIQQRLAGSWLFSIYNPRQNLTRATWR